MVQQGVHQRAGPVTTTGMHNQASRFVDNEQHFVFINNIERNIFRLFGQVASILRLIDEQEFTAIQLALGLDLALAVDQHVTVAHPGLHTVARVLRQEF